jgi:RimJ/RimL family protein N-acetyltransferase
MQPVLGDGVITLRPWGKDDAETLVDAIDGDPEIARWLDQVPQPYTLEDARAYIAGEIGRDEQAFAITDAVTGRVLGSIGVRAAWEAVSEIGYWLRADARGRGLTARALVLAARWALEQPGVARVQLRADPENVASCRVAERAGFTFEGVLRSVHWNERLGRRQDHAIYSLLPGEGHLPSDR